jgi:stage III sporulation protein AA
MREMTEYIFGYSMYAHEEELRQGYLTLKGGHRVGITGEAVMEQGMVKRIKNISSFNIRISRQIKGAADHIMKYAGKNLLLISPPCMGKTTLLRDILRQLADTPGENVGIVDERSEIAACYRGRPSNDCGERVDVLDGCPKAEGMLMLLRSMSPTVIGVDELGQNEDVEAVLRIVGSGVRIIATVHGDNMQQIQNKRVFAALFENQVFHYSLLLGKHEIKAYDGNGNVLEVISC